MSKVANSKDREITNVLRTSFKLAYDDHVGRLLAIPQLYLDDIRPDRSLPLLDTLRSYNADISRECERYGEAIRAEVMQVLEKAGGPLTVVLKENVLSEVSSFLDPQLYEERFNIFLDSIKWHLSRYGVEFQKENYRIDVPRSLSSVGAKNTRAKFVTRISNDIDKFTLPAQQETRSTWYSILNQKCKRHPLLFWAIELVVAVVSSSLFH
jgi:hypothetical protein